MNAMSMKRSAWFRMLVLGAILAGMAGCTNIRSYYPIVPHSEVSCPSTQEAGNKPTVALRWEFQTDGKPRQAVTDKWAPHVKGVLSKIGVFSQVNTSGEPSDYTLNVTMNNVVDSYAGAIAQGVLSGLTLGLIGTKVTDVYACTAILTSQSGKGTTVEYKYGVTSTSGLIVSGVEGVLPRKQLDDAFTVILDQFLFKSITDLQKDGRLQMP